jgi:hypothetical protein
MLLPFSMFIITKDPHHCSHWVSHYHHNYHNHSHPSRTTTNLYVNYINFVLENTVLPIFHVYLGDNHTHHSTNGNFKMNVTEHRLLNLWSVKWEIVWMKTLYCGKINGVSLEVYSPQVLQTPIIKEYDLHIHQGLLFLIVADNSKF